MKSQRDTLHLALARPRSFSFGACTRVLERGIRRPRQTLAWLLVAFLAAAPLAASPAGAQENAGPEVSEALGMNVHFVHPQPGEIQALEDTGVRWVRTSLDWAGTEQAPGAYDFSAYDTLLAELEGAHLHTLFILCYYNPLYDHGLSPASDEARQAFAHWAAAAVTHFRGRRILWEIYNEPNFRFWTPRPNTEDYIKLALAVGEAVAESAPDEKLVGPASAVIDPSFLEACFRAGLLNYWSAVSIHPYRQSDPETLADDLLQVRLLIRKYAPAGKTVPIITSEWGYSAVWNGMNEQKQAEMLARGWLTQVASDVQLSFWYDWESGGDPRDPEQHFGLIGTPAAPAGGGVTFPRKPAYQAAQTLTRFFSGFRFNKRLALDRPEDYLLLFSKGEEVRLAAWTTAAPHPAILPTSAGAFEVTGVTGESEPAQVADRHGLAMTLTNQPQYLVPSAANDLLALAAAWQRLPIDIEVRAPGVLPLHVPVTNPLERTIRVRLKGLNARFESGPPAKAAHGDRADLWVRLEAITRAVEPVPIGVELEAFRLGRVAQVTALTAENPLRVTLLPVTPGSLPVLVTSLARDGFKGRVVATHSAGIEFRSESAALDLAPGKNDVTVNLPLVHVSASGYEAGIQVLDQDGGVVLLVPPSRFLPLGDFSRYRAGTTPAGYKLELEEAAPAGNALVSAVPAEGPPEAGMGALELSFTLPPGRSSVRLVDADPAATAILGEPKALGMWMDGDNSRVLPYLRFVDSTGQVFEEGGGSVDWKGWRYVLIFVNAPQGSHAGGANDGVIHYPIHWDSLLVLRNPFDRQLQGTIYITGPTLIYGPVAGSR